MVFSHNYLDEMGDANLFSSRAMLILFKYLISQESGSILRMRSEPAYLSVESKGPGSVN